jgi:hypothetical protein
MQLARPGGQGNSQQRKESIVSLKKAMGPMILGTVLSASLMVGSAIPAYADRDDQCRHDMQRAEQNLDKAIRKHGEHSRQAEDKRRQLEEIRERCHMRDEHRDEHRDDDHR